MADEPQIKEMFYEIVMLAKRLGTPPLNTFPGCWEHQIDERWWIAVNGHREPAACSKGGDVPPFNAYLLFNGFPAGVVGPYGGIIAAGGVANEDAFIEAVKSAGGTRPLMADTSSESLARAAAELDAKATPGPWFERLAETSSASTHVVCMDRPEDDGLSPKDVYLHGRTIGKGFSGNDARFIAFAREALPTLATALLAEHARAERLAEELHYANGVADLAIKHRDIAEAEVATLRGALLDAAEDIESWGAYAGEYFQQKHDLAGCVARYRDAALSTTQGAKATADGEGNE